MVACGGLSFGGVPQQLNYMKKTAKRIKIVLGINSLVSTKHIAYSNHFQWAFRLGRNYPHIDFCFVNPSRMSIDHFRNLASKTAMETEADYLLFLDDDVIIPMDCLGKLLAMDADIASADVIIRSWPFHHMLFHWGKGAKSKGLYSMPKLPNPRGVIDVAAVGNSLTLYKTSLLKKVPTPHFVTGTNNTEDIYFCVRAQEAMEAAGEKIKIQADTSIICHHILWEETISSYNKKHFKRYQELQFGFGKPEESDDRGESYLAKVEKAFGLEPA